VPDATAAPGSTTPTDGAAYRTIDDPMLARAKAAIAQGDAAAAAQALRTALAEHRPSGEQLARWSYLEGGLRARTGDHAGAASAFEAAAAQPGWILAPYANLGAARALAALGRHAQAAERAAAVPDELPIGAAARLVRADALEAAGSTRAAVDLWKAHLAARRRGHRWAELSVRVGDWLLRQGPDASRAREAHALLRAVQLEAPASAWAARAAELDARALAMVPEAERDALRRLGPEERLARAQALSDAGRRDEAVKACADILAHAPAKGGTRADCETALLMASTLSRSAKKPAAADAYADAIRRCDRHPALLPTALLQGAKQHAAAGRLREALALYARIESELPKHSYADDARVRGARAAAILKDETRFVAMLSKLPDDYPDGDMLEDGLFELALHRIVQGDWTGAVAPLERSLSLRPAEKPYWYAGRARYFLARAYERAGRGEEAVAALRRVVRDHPLSYYMVLAYSRLAASDLGAARELVRASEAREEAGALVAPPGPELAVPAFARALELLRLGESAAAREEVLSLGLSGDRHAQALWTVAAAYARAGAAELAFRVARGRSHEWSDHYPAGKWRAAWEMGYPRAHETELLREAQRASIPPPLGWGIMREESAFDPDAVSSASAYGLMQLILPTARRVGESLGLSVDADSVRRPEVNIALGCKFLSTLRASFPAAPLLAIPSYNAGPGATRKWLDSRSTDDLDVWVESIPYEETRGYTKRVTSSVATYGYLYDRERADEYLRVPLTLKP
jgi:soluble lytic murein transglycosylase